MLKHAAKALTTYFTLAIALLPVASQAGSTSPVSAEPHGKPIGEPYGEPYGEPKPAIILDAGEATPINFPLHPTSRLAHASANMAGMSFFEIELPPNSAGAPPHRHNHEDEFFYVREGKVTFLADGKRQTLSAGGFALLPRAGWHALWNSDNKPATVFVGTSAGKFDDFFDQVAIEVAKSKPSSPQEMGAILTELAEQRGIAIDLNRLPDDVRALYGLPPITQSKP